jgi:GalNAc-alpha-(1->4)-GalNAc-alpha-(1->3)-diNAcBac-PP-undecaprenol alpha-1,4-N-acetyl-D-galactosaminyltransferase
MKDKNKKITLVISTLSCGGAERVLVLLTRGFIARGYEVSVITLDSKNSDFYQLPSETKRLALGIMGSSTDKLAAIKNNFQRIARLRNAIQSTEPDLVISFLRLTNIITIIALLGVNYPIIVTEHNDPQIFSYGRVWETLRHLTYRYSTVVVSVSQGVDRSFKALPQHKRAVIYNPIIIQESDAVESLPPDVDVNKNWLVSMGRLTEQKGFDRLLQAFKKIALQHDNWQLLILGQGKLKEQLERMRDDLGLSHRVVFVGSLRNPFPVLRRAKLFVMASRNEGFPMAHGEALACGLPVIATDCPSGPREMIRDKIDGLLVPNGDVDALATAMEQLMSDEGQRRYLASNAREVTQRFNIETILDNWEELFARFK